MAKGAVHQLQLSFLIATWKDEVVLQCIIFDIRHDRSIHRAYHIDRYVGSTKKYECWYVWYGLIWYVIWYDNVWSKIVSANGELLDVQLDVAVNNLKRVDPKEAGERVLDAYILFVNTRVTRITRGDAAKESWETHSISMKMDHGTQHLPKKSSCLDHKIWIKDSDLEISKLWDGMRDQTWTNNA